MASRLDERKWGGLGGPFIVEVWPVDKLLRDASDPVVQHLRLNEPRETGMASQRLSGLDLGTPHASVTRALERSKARVPGVLHEKHDPVRPHSQHLQRPIHSVGAYRGQEGERYPFHTEGDVASAGFAGSSGDRGDGGCGHRRSRWFTQRSDVRVHHLVDAVVCAMSRSHRSALYDVDPPSTA
jgi:hypothetical protein